MVVNKGVESSVGAKLESSCGALVKKGEDKNLVQDIILEDKILEQIIRDNPAGQGKQTTPLILIRKKFTNF